MDDWALNEEDELARWQGAEEPATDYVDTLSGQDSTGTVTVHVTHKANVVAVELVEGWKNSIESHSLHTHVVAAANAATTQALAKRLEVNEEGLTTRANSGSDRDVSHYNKEDVSRLLDAVAADLEQFSQQVSSVADEPASACSGGGHVSGSAQQGQILALSIDVNWLASVQKSEIESELLDVLRQLGSQSSPGQLENGPQSSAIMELNTLAQDPNKLLRAVGLPPILPNN